MGKSSKNDGVKKVIDAIKSIQKEKKKTLKTNMRSVRQYLYKTIRNSFKRTPKKRRNGPPLYVFDEDGKRLCMVQSLLNNSFRAFGHGSYQKEKVQTSYKGFNILGTYCI